MSLWLTEENEKLFSEQSEHNVLGVAEFAKGDLLKA
jgi:hypothetical protein